MTAVSVSLTASDLTFSFSDSCNCCCFGRKKVTEDTIVYINSRGELEKFKIKKASSEHEAYLRSKAHLLKTIEQIATIANLDHSLVIKEIEDRAFIVLTLEDIKPFTYGDIKRINRAILDVFNSPVSVS